MTPAAPQPPVDDLDLRLPDDVDHCYRHPDRETGVHCATCGRAICHECMTQAAVGFRCPECMAEERHGQSRTRVVTRQQTRSRWQAGGLGSGGWTVTKVLVALNVAYFLVEVATGATSSTLELVRLGALVPAYVTVRHEYWRMFSVMFLHASVIHILFNMWALWIIGTYVEAVLGHLKFLVLYLVAGIGGSVLVLVAAPAFAPTVGASGAIFGIFGALALYAFVNRNRDVASRAILGQMVFLLVINLVLSFSGGISWQGHIGGLIVGTVLMGAYMLLGRKSPYGRFTSSDVAATIIIVGVLVLITVWRIETFTFAALLPWL